MDVYQTALGECSRSYAIDIPRVNLEEYHKLASRQRITAINLYQRLNFDSFLAGNGLYSPWPFTGRTPDQDEFVILGASQEVLPGPIYLGVVLQYLNLSGGNRPDVVSYVSVETSGPTHLYYRHYSWEPIPSADDFATGGVSVSSISVRSRVQRSGYLVSARKAYTVPVTHWSP